jgi:hypothetical protein
VAIWLFLKWTKLIADGSGSIENEFTWDETKAVAT